MLLPRLFGRLLHGRKITGAGVFDGPKEEIISAGRVILAAVLLLTVLISPDLLAGPGTPAFGLLIGYTGFAVVLTAMRVWRIQGRAPGYAIHIIDITFLFAFSALTEWRGGPFFAFFIFFILFTAGLRWSWRAVLVTAAVLDLGDLGYRYRATAGAGASAGLAKEWRSFAAFSSS